MNRKLAIITGGGTGIGRSLALQLASEEIELMIVGRRLAYLKEVAAHFPNYIRIVNTDISTNQGRNALLTVVGDRSIDFLVHNAGVIDPIEPLLSLELECFKSNFAINMEAPLFLTTELINNFSNTRVLFLSSGAAYHAKKGWSAYCISKAAAQMLYQCCQEEIAENSAIFGILSPGVVDTEMQSKIRSADAVPENKKWGIELKASGKLLTADDVGKFIAWVLLCSNSKQFVSESWSISDPWHHNYWKTSE